MKNKEKVYIFNKLIRDKMPELFQAEGSKIDVRVLDDTSEFLNLLYKKAEEELKELFTAENFTDVVEECADLEEVLHTLKQIHGISQEQVETARLLKQLNRGGYDKRLFLTTVCCKEGSRSSQSALKNEYEEVSEDEYRALCVKNEKMQQEHE